MSHISLLSTGWILWGIVLISLTGIAFMPVARAQTQLYAIARREIVNTRRASAE